MRFDRRAVLAALLAPFAFAPTEPAPAQQPWEGVIVSTMHDEDENQSWQFTTSLKGTKARIESPAMEGAYQLVDVPAQMFIMVMPSQKTYLKFDLSGVGDDDEAPVKIEAMGKSETIAGHSCTYYRYVQDGETYEICAAKGIGFGTMGGSGNLSKKGLSLPPDFEKTFKDGFQPLKMQRVSGGKATVIMQVTSITRKALPASLFELPAGYKEMQMGPS